MHLELVDDVVHEGERVRVQGAPALGPALEVLVATDRALDDLARRLLLMLVRLGYPPVIVLKTTRPHYLAAMEKADGGDYGPLGEILARAMYDNLNRFIVPNVAGPARLVPLAALADHDFSAVALRQAAQRGRLDAVVAADGTWRSSRRAVEAYARTKGQRRTRSSVVDQIN